MVQIGIEAFLVFSGIMIGKIRREFLIYLLFVLIPFFGVGTIKGLNLTCSDLAVYLCALPQAFFLIIRLVRRNYKGPGFAGLIILLTVLMLYLFDRYLASIHPDRLYFFKCLLFAMAIFVYALVFYQDLKPEILIRLTGAMIVFQATVALLQMAKGFDISRILFFIDSSSINPSFTGGMGFARGTGSFPDPNYYALYMGILVSSLLPALKRFLIKICYLLGLAGILFSFSRMGVMICGILLAAYFWKNVRIDSPRQLCRICFWLAGLIAAGSYLAGNYAEIPMASAMVERFQYNDGNIGDAQGTRDFIVKFYYHHLLELPNPSELFIGSGFENFEYLLNAKTGIFLVAHNEYIQIMADIGLLGYAVLAAIIIYLLKKSRFKALPANPYRGSVWVMLFGFFFLTCTYEMYCYFYLALFFGFRMSQKESFLKLTARKEYHFHEGQSHSGGYKPLSL